jgi:hypothetical protein
MSESFAFLDDLLGATVAEGGASAEIERWKDSMMFKEVNNKRGIISLAKFMASLNTEEVNDDMQTFYQSIKAYANDPIQPESLRGLIRSRDLAIGILVKLSADMDTTHTAFFAGRMPSSERPSSSATTPIAEPLEILAPTLGGGASREEFLDAHLRQEVSGHKCQILDGRKGNSDITVYLSWHICSDSATCYGPCFSTGNHAWRNRHG